jgi:tetratricopeptide (TPR) repeat protein
LVIVTFAAYQPAWHAGFIWDDDSYVTENQALRSLDGLGRIWVKPGTTAQYYPLVFTTFWAEYHLWKLQPLGYHLANILLHALNAVLLWRVLRRLEIPGSWWAAAVFALHPVNVESVAWITECKNVLSGLFYFLAVLAYLRFRPLTDRGATRAGDWRYYPLVLVLFLCALLSKTVTCSLPAVLMLLVWWKTGRVERRDALALAPLFVLGVASGFMTTWMEKHSVGASGGEWALSFVQRCLVAGRALWFYAGKLCWPRHFSFIYPRWEIDARVAWPYLFPVAAVVVLIALWLLRSRIGRGPLVAGLCFAGTLVPALGFFDVYPFRYSYVADHFQYLACIGLISLAVSTGAAICQRAVHGEEHSRRAGQRGRDLGTIAAAIVLLILGASTWRQACIYQNMETLWRDTLTKNPQCWMAHNDLGIVLVSLGRVQEATEHYEQVLQINPRNAAAHNNLGLALVSLGRVQEAIAHYEQALQIKPDYAEAHYNLGIALAQTGKIEEAVAHYEQALRIKPDHAEAHYNLGVALAQAGRVGEAIRHLEQALRIKPDYAEAHYNLGVALARLGRLQEAMGHWEQALRIKPDYAEAHYNLGVALAQADRVGEAIRHLEQALRIKPDYAEAHYNLGVALAQADRVGEAIRHLEQALRIKPDYAEAHNNLGTVFLQEGKFNDAIGHYEQALRIKPDHAEAHYNLGVALAQAGRVGEAIRHLEQALRIKPDFTQAQNALARLQARQ